MTKRFAQVLSYLFHPALVPSIGTLMVLATIPAHVPEGQIYFSLAFVFLSTYILPGFFSVMLRYMGIIESLHMKSPKDRRYPFLIAIAFFLFAANSLSKQQLPTEIVRLLLASAITLMILYLLLRYSKWSVHMAGAAGVTATAIYLSHEYGIMMLEIISTTILFSGLLGTARLKLKAHTLAQVVFGYITGLIVTFSCLIA